MLPKDTLHVVQWKPYIAKFKDFQNKTISRPIDRPKVLSVAFTLLNRVDIHNQGRCVIASIHGYIIYILLYVQYIKIKRGFCRVRLYPYICTCSYRCCKLYSTYRCCTRVDCKSLGSTVSLDPGSAHCPLDIGQLSPALGAAAYLCDS